MSIADKTDPSQTSTLCFEFDLAHSSQTIWRALTEPALLSQWLLPVIGLHLEKGSPFTFQTQPQPGWDGIVHCRMMDVELHKKITWAWVVGDMDTLVTFTLTPAPVGTRLTLVHSGFKPNQKANFGGARYGWKMMGAKLADLLGTLPSGDAQ